MNIYLKLFDNHEDYITYITGNDKVLPNVSYCKNQNEVHFNPYFPPIMATFNVSNLNNSVRLCRKPELLDEIEIDGVKQETISEYYTFNVRGIHKVNFKFKDPKIIESGTFSYCTELESINIPNGVTTISQNTFSSSGIKRLSIPRTVTEIADLGVTNNLTNITIDSENPVYDSRDNCNAIIETSTNILIKGAGATTIPNTVVSIANRAFSRCKALTTIDIPDSVTTIGSYAFNECSNLNHVNISDHEITINSYAFYAAHVKSFNSNETGKCVIRNNMNIGFSAFFACDFTNIVIEDGFTTISDSLFGNCKKLVKVTIPNSVTNLGDDTFSGCSALKSIGEVGSGSSVEIPDSIKTLNDGIFRECTGITSVTIPNSITTIGGSVFSYCSSLTSITIPNSVTTVGSAFSFCTSLSSVIIGNSVTSFVQEDGFRGCTALTTITSLAMTAPIIKNTTFTNIKENGTLYVPIGSTGYDVWMGTGNYYLGKYNWTKVEQ